MAGDLRIVLVCHGNDPPAQAARRCRYALRPPMRAARWGDNKNRHVHRVGKAFDMPPLFQILPHGKNTRRLDQLCRAVECRAIIRATAQHDHNRACGNHLRYLSTVLLNRVRGGIHSIGEVDQFPAQHVCFFLGIPVLPFAQLNRPQ